MLAGRPLSCCRRCLSSASFARMAGSCQGPGCALQAGGRAGAGAQVEIPVLLRSHAGAMPVPIVDRLVVRLR